jgi:hypothetical protein
VSKIIQIDIDQQMIEFKKALEAKDDDNEEIEVVQKKSSSPTQPPQPAFGTVGFDSKPQSAPPPIVKSEDVKPAEKVIDARTPGISLKDGEEMVVLFSY